MELFVQLLVVAAILAIACYALQPHYVFVVRIEGCTPKVAKGKVTAAFLQELTSLCTEFDVRRGRVCGLRRGRRVVLVFSPEIPAGCQQRLRNLWTAS